MQTNDSNGSTRLTLRPVALLAAAVAPLALASHAGGAPAQGERPTAVTQPQAHEARVIQISASDLRFHPERIEVRPGEKLAIELVNHGSAPHNIEFELPGGERELENALSPGEAGRLEFTAPEEPGEYTLYCPVADHAERGMTGTLVVVEEGQPGGDNPRANERVDAQSMTIKGDWKGPESALHDPDEDVYLISNVNGGTTDKDDNGFIARVSPDGEVKDLRWIDGKKENVTLHAPKGMAISGDTLYIADIDAVRLFDRRTGEPKGEWPVEDATFLNAIAVAPDGSVYVTDTAINIAESGDLQQRGADAVHRFDRQGTPRPIATGDRLNGPNGIVAHDRGVIFASFLGDELWLADGRGEATRVATLPQGRLDGLLRLGDGSLLVTSWEGEAVYHVEPTGESRKVVEGVTSPADIALDQQRHRLLIPMLTEDEVRVVALPRQLGAK